jgi:twitching motility protein PilT
MEILVHTPLIEKLIMENRDYEIHETLEKGKAHYKSQSFDQSLLDLYNEGVISKEHALENATSAADLQLKMSGLSGGVTSADNVADLVQKEESVAQEEDVIDLK